MSKFQGVFDAARSRQDREDDDAQAPAAPITAVTEGGKRGRPSGKRSDPAYEQVTAYIRRDTHTRAKIALLQAGDRQEFSELIEALLTDWLEARGE